MTEKPEKTEAAPPPPQEHTAVRPLEWAVGDWTFVAHTPFGDYEGRENRDQWIAGGLLSGTYQTIGAFQAAASADYQRRVLACLSTPPQQHMTAPGQTIVAYASSTRPNVLCSAAQFNSALPKNRTDFDVPLVRADAEHDRSVGIGMAIAAGILMRVWGRETEAKEILGAAGLDTIQKLRACGVDEYDIEALTPILATTEGSDA